MCDSKDDVLEKMLLHFEKDRQEYLSDQMQWIKAAMPLRADVELSLRYGRIALLLCGASLLSIIFHLIFHLISG